MTAVEQLVHRLLARAPGGGFAMQTLDCAGLDDAQLEPLHAMARAQMAEPYEHFRAHALSNDVLHVFRSLHDEAVVGFQFWRSLHTASGDFVLGGKLRILPEARRRGLHLAAGLSVLLSEHERHPGRPLTRIGVASLFGFVSVARRLDHYAFVTAESRAELVDTVDLLTSASHFRYDPATGLVDVGIFVTEAQLRAYPAAYFDSETARAYLARNPRFRDNGCYLAYAFEADPANLRSLSRGTCQAVLGDTDAARAFDRELQSGL